MDFHSVDKLRTKTKKKTAPERSMGTQSAKLRTIKTTNEPPTEMYRE